MKNITYILNFFLLLIGMAFFYQCEKEKPVSLPPITTTGANTLGCIIDGEIFEDRSQGMNSPSVLADYITDSPLYEGERITTTGFGNNNNTIGFSVNKEKIVENEKNLLNEYSTLNYGLLYDNVNDIDYFTNYKHYGEVIILKLDTVRHIVAGTFWFDAISDDGSVVEVRNGRFDIVY